MTGTRWGQSETERLGWGWHSETESWILRLWPFINLLFHSYPRLGFIRLKRTSEVTECGLMPFITLNQCCRSALTSSTVFSERLVKIPSCGTLAHRAGKVTVGLTSQWLHTSHSAVVYPAQTDSESHFTVVSQTISPTTLLHLSYTPLWHGWPHRVTTWHRSWRHRRLETERWSPLKSINRNPTWLVIAQVWHTKFAVIG